MAQADKVSRTQPLNDLNYRLIQDESNQAPKNTFLVNGLSRNKPCYNTRNKNDFVMWEKKKNKKQDKTKQK